MSHPNPDTTARIDLWLCPTDAVTSELAEAIALPFLNPAEIADAQKARRPAAYRQRLLSQALLRYLLSYQTGLAPEQWRFGRREHGKPHVSAPDVQPRLHFNLSHSDDAILIGLTTIGEIGVDIEATDRRVAAEQLAQRYFHPNEQAALAGLADEPRRQRFLEMWTLKEAYAKARGLGLRIPVRNIETESHPGDRLSLLLHGEPALPPERQWCVYALRWEARWIGSALVDCNGNQPPDLTLHQVELGELGFYMHPKSATVIRGTTRPA